MNRHEQSGHLILYFIVKDREGHSLTVLPFSFFSLKKIMNMVIATNFGAIKLG